MMINNEFHCLFTKPQWSQDLSLGILDHWDWLHPSSVPRSQQDLPAHLSELQLHRQPCQTLQEFHPESFGFLSISFPVYHLRDTRFRVQPLIWSRFMSTPSRLSASQWICPVVLVLNVLNDWPKERKIVVRVLGMNNQEKADRQDLHLFSDHQRY